MERMVNNLREQGNPDEYDPEELMQKYCLLDWIAHVNWLFRDLKRRSPSPPSVTREVGKPEFRATSIRDVGTPTGSETSS